MNKADRIHMMQSLALFGLFAGGIVCFPVALSYLPQNSGAIPRSAQSAPSHFSAPNSSDGLTRNQRIDLWTTAKWAVKDRLDAALDPEFQSALGLDLEDAITSGTRGRHHVRSWVEVSGPFGIRERRFWIAEAYRDRSGWRIADVVFLR